MRCRKMKLYLNRFIHHVGGLTNLSALRFTRYDQYNSIVKPMVKYLENHGCKFQYNIKVTDVDFDISENRKVATKIIAEDKDVYPDNAAPGMPAGSPGMDVPNSPPYDTLLVSKDGNTRVFAKH